MRTLNDKSQDNKTESVANSNANKNNNNEDGYAQDNSPETLKMQEWVDKVDSSEAKTKKNNTGVPDALLHKMEQLSGLDLSEVKVYYNSEKPAEINAEAYAEGTNIYLGPGKKDLLEHELWHVVQQLQGRVKGDTEIDGKKVNTSKSKEDEADNVPKTVETTNEPLTKAKVGEEVVQGKFTGDAFKVFDLLNTLNPPAIFSLLFKKLHELQDTDIAINLYKGGSPMNFNYGDSSINLNAKSIMDAITMAQKKEDGWESLLAFVFSSASHELRHAYDFYISKLQFPKGKVTEFSEIWPLYKTELNAWGSEARSYLEMGELENELLQSWLSFDSESEDASNMIWSRLKGYTDGVFQYNLPGDKFTWDAKMKAKFMKSGLIDHILTLQTKMKGRVDAAKLKKEEEKE
jgi:hypothetical protein